MPAVKTAQGPKKQVQNSLQFAQTAGSGLLPAGGDKGSSSDSDVAVAVAGRAALSGVWTLRSAGGEVAAKPSCGSGEELGRSHDTPQWTPGV